MGKIGVCFFIISLLGGLLYAKGGEDVKEPPFTSEYETYFRGLSPQEQVEEFISFSGNYAQLAPPEFEIAQKILLHETGLEAMPYLKKEFEQMEFEHCSGGSWTDLCNESPMHLLSLISDMVWLSGFPKNEGIILRPADGDIEWFIQESEEKISRYVKKYKRLDFTMSNADFLIRGMISVEKVQEYNDAKGLDRIKFLYDKYVGDDPDLKATVGIPKEWVFDGFSGPILED